MPFKGSADLQTSTANQEIIPTSPADWTIGYQFSKFSFVNDQDCHVKINGGDSIFVRANQGIEHDNEKDPIKSFVIVESAITFNWVGYM